MADATTSIIVLNYNNGSDTLRCLENVEEALRNDPRLSLVVVDNDSSDASGKAIKDWCTDPVRDSLPVNFVRSLENGGYGAGNNQGIEAAKRSFAPEWYWILNNDAMLQSDTAKIILNHLVKSHGQIIGMRIHTVGQDPDQDILGGGVLRRWQGRTVMSRPVARLQQIEFVSGSSFVVRASLVALVGKLVEDHFLFWEEIEFAQRAADANAAIEVVPDALVHHIGGAASGASAEGKSRKAFYYSTRAAALYFGRHESKMALAWLVVARLFLALQCLLARRPSDAVSVLRGLRDGLNASIPGHA